MGKECPRPVASGSEHYIRKVISSGTQKGENLGGEADGKGRVARSTGVCRESWYRQVSAARPPPDLCTPLPRRGRRTGADPVSARSHFDSDNRTISRLQTAHSRCRQRQNRNRAIGLSEPLTVRFTDDMPGIGSVSSQNVVLDFVSDNNEQRLNVDFREVGQCTRPQVSVLICFSFSEFVRTIIVSLSPDTLNSRTRFLATSAAASAPSRWCVTV